MHILIGSQALNYNMGRCVREPKDVDFFIDEDFKLTVTPLSKRIEQHHLPRDIHKAIEANCSPFGIISLNDLYTLKLSHVFWPIHHHKTIADIVFLQDKGCQVNKPLFYMLKAHWKTIHGNKDFLSLNKNKKEFFDDFVKKEVDHDLIHTWVAKYDEPLYTRCLADSADVMTDYKKFSDMIIEDRIHMITEEIMTIGIERFGIPSNFSLPSGVCYLRAMRLTLTNLLKGKFANFAAFNLSEIAKYKMTNEYLIAKEKYYAYN